MIVFLSDIHLGTKQSKAKELLQFLNYYENEFEIIYLVGDIIDFWSLQTTWYWDIYHNNVIKKLLELNKTIKIIYIVGNHDNNFKICCGHKFDNIEIKEQTIHETKNGKKILVIHGDQYDFLINRFRTLSILTNRISKQYFIHKIGIWFDWCTNIFYNKDKKIKEDIKKHEVDGLIFGHYHHPEIHEKYNFLYINTGDWTNHCSYVIEDDYGEMKLMEWKK